MKYAKLKSNRAFTIQDLAIAILIILLFVGTISSGFVMIYKVQAKTKIDSVAMLFIVQIMEHIDKIGYNEVSNENINNLISNMRYNFSIPEEFNINIEIEPDSITNNLVKTVDVTLSYNIINQDRAILVKTLKVKEFEGENNEK